MGVKIGGIDVFRQSLESEYRITVLEMIMEEILKKDPSLISQKEIEGMQQKAIKLLQTKYPSAGIQKMGDEDASRRG